MSSASRSPLGSATRPSLTSDSTGRCRVRTVGSGTFVSSFRTACTRDFLVIARPFNADHGTSRWPNIVRVASPSRVAIVRVRITNTARAIGKT